MEDSLMSIQPRQRYIISLQSATMAAIVVAVIVTTTAAVIAALAVAVGSSRHQDFVLPDEHDICRDRIIKDRINRFWTAALVKAARKRKKHIWKDRSKRRHGCFMDEEFCRQDDRKAILPVQV